MMIRHGSISEAIHEGARRRASSLAVEDVRIGLGFAAVVLEGNRLGLAAVLRHNLDPGCSVFRTAGTLAGGRASRLLDLIVRGTNPLEKALGLAAANAVFSTDASTVEAGVDGDTLDLAGLTPDDRVVMVGFFRPLVNKIEKTGASLSIVELDPARPGYRDGPKRDEALEGATVALVTATSILNDTVEATLNRLTGARHVTLLGPSTPLYPAAFQGTPVNHLGGSVSMDNTAILRVVSEGGGTPAMRPWLGFINLLWRR